MQNSETRKQNQLSKQAMLQQRYYHVNLSPILVLLYVLTDSHINDKKVILLASMSRVSLPRFHFRPVLVR